jgi:hypothetical protein
MSMPHKAVAVTAVDTIVELYGRIIYIRVIGRCDADEIVRDLDLGFVEVVGDFTVFIFADTKVIGRHIQDDLALGEIYDEQVFGFGIDARSQIELRVADYEFLLIGLAYVLEISRVYIYLGVRIRSEAVAMYEPHPLFHLILYDEVGVLVVDVEFAVARYPEIVISISIFRKLIIFERHFIDRVVAPRISAGRQA